MKLNIFTDGGSRNNPGDAGIGVVIIDSNDKIIRQVSEYIGIETNNVAEYKAFIKGLRRSHKFRG